MLVLTRKEGEEIDIGDDIKIIVRKIGKGDVRIGIVADKSVNISRPDAKSQKTNRERKGV